MFPCKLSGKAIVNVLPVLLKEEIEKELLRSYSTRCLRIITENTAMLSQGHYISIDFDDILNPKVEPEENNLNAASNIRAKLRE